MKQALLRKQGSASARTARQPSLVVWLVVAFTATLAGALLAYGSATIGAVGARWHFYGLLVVREAIAYVVIVLLVGWLRRPKFAEPSPRTYVLLWALGVLKVYLFLAIFNADGFSRLWAIITYELPAAIYFAAFEPTLLPLTVFAVWRWRPRSLIKTPEGDAKVVQLWLGRNASQISINRAARLRDELESLRALSSSLLLGSCILMITDAKVTTSELLGVGLFFAAVVLISVLNRRVAAVIGLLVLCLAAKNLFANSSLVVRAFGIETPVGLVALAALGAILQLALLVGLAIVCIDMLQASRQTYSAARIPHSSSSIDIGGFFGIPNFVAFLPRRFGALGPYFGSALCSSLFTIVLFYLVLGPFFGPVLAQFTGHSPSERDVWNLLSELIRSLSALAIALYAIGSLFRNIAQRAAVKSYQSIRHHDARAPVLYLRAFNQDGARLNLRANSVLGALTVRLSAASTLDALILENASQHGPVIAIGSPDEDIPPLGAARVYVEGSDWQSIVADLMRQSRVCLICLERTVGLQWELQHAENGGFLPKAIFLAHPQLRRADSWRLFEYHFPSVTSILSRSVIQKSWPIAAFIDGGEVRVLTANSPSQRAFAVAIRWALTAKSIGTEETGTTKS